MILPPRPRVQWQISGCGYVSRALAHGTQAIWTRLTYLTFASLDHRLAPMDRKATCVHFELTPQERNEVEAALPAIAPVSGVAADVLQRMLDADPTGPRRTTGPAEQ